MTFPGLFQTELTFASTVPSGSRSPARGPLRTHPENPRYFTDGSGQAVYLTGSHTWMNLQDQGSQEPPPAFGYPAYLDWLARLNHNSIRLWAWEQARWAPWSDGRHGASDWFIRPSAYLRSGPGLALDGQPKFDLDRFDSAYFHRLRQRVVEAGQRGIYVSVMLFQGWSASKPWLDGQPFRGHPYHPSNNIQGFDGSPGGETGPDLDSPLVRERQAAYIRQVVDTVGDLENVLYEVANEGGTKGWDWWVVDTIHTYERARPHQHPVGITAHGSETNDDLLESPADWISPGSSNWPDLMTDPRPADGRKVFLLDTDHVFGVGGDQKWVWKGFLRGYNVWYMDPYDDPEWQPVLKNQNFLDIASEPARQAMGHTRACAARINLAKSYPDPAIASTGYCLAVLGQAYLAYQPDGGSLSVDLRGSPGAFTALWIHPITGQETPAPQVEGGAKRELTPPFAGDAVLFLKAAG